MLVYDEFTRSDALGLRILRRWIENNYAIAHGDGNRVRGIVASSGTAHSHPAVHGRRCLSPCLLAGRPEELTTNADESQKSKHGGRRVLTRATTPPAGSEADDGRCGRKACVPEISTRVTRVDPLGHSVSMSEVK